MAIVAETYDFVIGGDTHRDTHSLAVIKTRTGGVVAESVIGNDTSGFDEAFNTATKLDGSRLWALEGTGSYGVNLTRFLQANGETVVEVERPARPKNAGPKTDAIDAERAGREVLRLDREVLGVLRCGGDRAAMAALMTVRDSAVDAAKHAAQQFHAMLLTTPQPICGGCGAIRRPPPDTIGWGIGLRQTALDRVVSRLRLPDPDRRIDDSGDVDLRCSVEVS